MRNSGRLPKIYVSITLAFVSVVLLSQGLSLPVQASDLCALKMRNLDGGRSPGTYEPDPDNQRRHDDEGGPYNEPGSDPQRRHDDPGGPYNEPGSDGGPY